MHVSLELRAPNIHKLQQVPIEDSFWELTAGRDLLQEDKRKPKEWSICRLPWEARLCPDLCYMNLVPQLFRILQKKEHVFLRCPCSIYAGYTWACSPDTRPVKCIMRAPHAAWEWCSSKVLGGFAGLEPPFVDFQCWKSGSVRRERIIEWPGLERTTVIIEFQPPCYVQGRRRTNHTLLVLWDSYLSPWLVKDWPFRTQFFKGLRELLYWGYKP